MAQGSREDEMEQSDEENVAAQCPICLLSLSESDVGTPECCDHDFCLRCILEWSKQKNTCPNDRQVFHIIFARHAVGGDIYEKIGVADAELKPEEELEDEPTFCEVCGECNDEDCLLLCDECDNGYHLYCLTPALDSVPQDNWYCPDCTLARGPQQPTTSVSRRGRGTAIPRTRDNIRIYRRVALAISSDDESSESDLDTEDVVLLDDSDDDAPQPRSNTTSARTPAKRSGKRTTGKRKTKRSPRKKRKTQSGSKYTRKSMRQRFTRPCRKTSTRQRLAEKLRVVPSKTGGSIPLIKQKKYAEEKEGLSVYGDRELSGFGHSSPVSKKIVINFKQQSRRPTSVSDNGMAGSTDLLSSIMDDQSLLGSSSKDIEITQEGRLKLKSSASSGSLSRSNTADLQKVTLNSGITYTSTPSTNTSHSVTQSSSKAYSQLNKQLHEHTTATTLSNGSSKLRANCVTSDNNKTPPALDVSSHSNSLENIPLPEGSQKGCAVANPLTGSSQNCSLDSIPLPGGEPVLKSYNHLRPQPPVVTTCPVYIKKEGRAAYDSHDRDSIREWFYQKYGDKNGGAEFDCDLDSEDDDIVALTPPPRSPEPVICVTTDTEDERNNIKKPPRRRKLQHNDTPVYSISSSSESERERRRHTSRQTSRSRHRSRSKKRSRRNSASRRHRRSRSRSVRRRSRHRSKSAQRHSSRSRHRSRSRRRNGGYSRRRSLTPDRHHRSPMRERTDVRGKRSHADHNRRGKKRTHSPMRRPSKSVSRRLSASPPKRQRSRSPYRRRRPRNDSVTPERVPMRRRSISPVQSSISPARLRRDYERSRRCESKEMGIGSTRLSGTSQTLFSEIERGYKKLYEGVEDMHEEYTADVDEVVTKPESRSKSKKKSRSDGKKKKKQKKSKGGSNDRDKKRKKHSKKAKELRVESEEEGQIPDEHTKSRSEGSRSSCGEASRVGSSNSSISSDRMSCRASPGRTSLNETPLSHSPMQAPANQVSPSKASLTKQGKLKVDTHATLYSPSEEAKLMGNAHYTESRGYDTEDSMKQMVIDIDEGSDHVSPTRNYSQSPAQLSPTRDPVSLRSATDEHVTSQSPTQHDAARVPASPTPSHDELVQSDAMSNRSMRSPCTSENPTQDSDEEDAEENGIQDAERLAEEQALRIIELLKNEVAEPDVGPPAQPPKSVSHKPEVLSWIAGNDVTDRATPTADLEGTPPIATNSQTTVDLDLPASATELSNKQLMAKMVGKERIADEIKIVLKPFYCTGKIDKDEYKQIMRNCVTKIYQKTQGKVNPMKVREFVEKYVGTVIARRKR